MGSPKPPIRKLMRRIVIIITFFLLALATSLMVSNVTFAQEKPTAALAPMGALGELDEIEKRIFFNSLQESLSKYYTLTSQKMYEKAEEEAFQVMMQMNVLKISVLQSFKSYYKLNTSLCLKYYNQGISSK